MTKILVVDDDKDLLEMITLVLRTYGMEVASLNNGTHFFHTLSRFTPDIIVMDIYLGDADGRILCKELKTTTDYAEIPVILYSAGTISQASIEESEADDFLQKPFDIGFLFSRIQQQLA